MAAPPPSRRRRVDPPGTLLFAEGDPGDEAYIVESGRVSVFKTIDGQRVVLGEICSGGIFGEMALIDDQPRMASAITEEETAIVIVGKQRLSEQLDLAPKGVRVMVAALLGNIRLLGSELAQARAILAEEPSP